MKKCIPALFAAFVLALALSACGEKEKARLSSSVPEPASRLIQSEAPEEPSSASAVIPQADDDLVKRIVLCYGALEDTYNTPVGIRPRKKSLYNQRTGWSAPEELDVISYLVWAEEYIPYDDLAPYQQEGPMANGFFFPQEMLEESVQRHFEVSTEYLRGDAECYDAGRGGYTLPGGGGMGARPVITYTYSQEGEVLTVPVTLTEEGAAPVVYTLTVRLEPEGGWKYLSCRVE